MRWIPKILLVFFILSLNLSLVYAINNTITANTVDGKAVYQGVDLAVQVIVLPPNLNILSPRNVTYWSNESLYLIYNSNTPHTAWYNLDNNGNVTVPSGTLIETTAGSHTLYLYVNNTDGLSTEKDVNFALNTTGIKIIYDKFKNYSQTTNFEYYGLEELQNLTNISLETKYGKIHFNSLVNVLQTPHTSNEIVLDDYIDISQNSIWIDYSNATNLDKPATLYLYNLTFTNPEILMDNQTCPPSICTIQSYSSNTLVFNVTHFSTYSAREKPSSQNTNNSGTGTGNKESSGGGGGAGGAPNPVIKTEPIINDNLKVYTEKIASSLKQGETKSDQITLKNTGNEPIEVTFELTNNLSSYMIFSSKDFSLTPGEIRNIPFDIIARETTPPDLYMGVIIVKLNGNIIGAIPVAIDVSSKKALFDTIVTIPAKYQISQPGENFMGQVDLFNFGETGRIDVFMEYKILNDRGEVVLSSRETTAVETSKSILKSFDLPSDIPEGNYVFYVRTNYAGNVASANQWFVIRKTKNVYKDLFIWAAILIIVLLVYIKNKKINKKKEKAVVLEVKESKKEETNKISISSADKKELDSLIKQLKQLEYVHSKGFVEDKEYLSTKSPIIERIKELKEKA